jgi:hypothetical protein
MYKLMFDVDGIVNDHMNAGGRHWLLVDKMIMKKV